MTYKTHGKSQNTYHSKKTSKCLQCDLYLMFKFAYFCSWSSRRRGRWGQSAELGTKCCRGFLLQWQQWQRHSAFYLSSTGQTVNKDFTTVELQIWEVPSRLRCSTWTGSVARRRLSCSHVRFGNDSKPVGQFGIEEKDVRTPGRSRFLLDCAVSI